MKTWDEIKKERQAQRKAPAVSANAPTWADIKAQRGWTLQDDPGYKLLEPGLKHAAWALGKQRQAQELYDTYAPKPAASVQMPESIANAGAAGVNPGRVLYDVAMESRALTPRDYIAEYEQLQRERDLQRKVMGQSVNLDESYRKMTALDKEIENLRQRASLAGAPLPEEGNLALAALDQFFQGGPEQFFSGIYGAIATGEEFLVNTAKGLFGGEKDHVSEFRQDAIDHQLAYQERLARNTAGLSPLESGVVGLSQAAGNMLFGAGLTGAAGLPTYFSNATKAAISVGAGGESYITALQQGANIDQAAAYALLSGATEYITESLFSGNPVADKVGKGLVSRVAGKLGGSSKLLGFLASKPVDILSEGLEEMIAEVLNPVWEYLTYNKNPDWASVEQVLEAGINGVVLSGALQGGASAINTAAGSVAKSKWINEAKVALGVNGQKAFESVAAQFDAENFASGTSDFYRAYTAGRNNTARPSTPQFEAQAQAAYFAGQNDAELDKNGGLIKDEGYKKARLTSADSFVIDSIGKLTGKTVSFVDRIADSKGNEANASIAGNSIRIALNGDQPVLTSLVHEVVHGIKAADQAAYESLRDYVAATLADPESVVAAKMQQYNTEDADFATEEVVADALGYALGDTATLQRFVQDNRTAAQRVFDALRNLVVKLREKLTGAKAVRKTEYEALMTNLQETLDAFEVALSESVKKSGDVQERYSAMYRNRAKSFDEMRNFVQQYRTSENKESGKSYYSHTLPSSKVVHAAFGDVAHMVDGHNLTGREFNAIVNAADDVKSAQEIRVMDWKGPHGGFVVSIKVSTPLGGGFAVLEIVSKNRTFVKNAYLGDTLTIDKKNRSYTLQPQDFMSPTGNTGSDSSVVNSLQQYFYKSNTQNDNIPNESERFSLRDRENERVEFSDANIKYSLREKAPPAKTGIAYKVFYAKNGELYPPMVANPDGAGTPVGVWLDADIGQMAEPSKTGRTQVQGGGRGTSTGKTSLAFRPGWHLGDTPLAKQFARTNPETGAKELFPADFVWAECEYAMDIDYQEEAMSYGYTEKGKFRHAYAGLPKIPEDGYYRYRTNPRPDTVPWIITGAMKVNRILTDAEVEAICRKNGVEPMARQGGPIDLAKYGLEEVRMGGGEVRHSLKDSEGNTLTPEQAEFFKDSKVRDENGNLLVMYHGTNEDIGNYISDVFYLSSDTKVAQTYGEKVTGYYVKLAAPLIIDAEGERWNKLDETGDVELLELGRNYDKEYAKEVGVYEDTALKTTRRIEHYASIRDFDGIIYKNIIDSASTSYMEPSTVVTVFSEGRVKSIDNKNPTADPDIRYSMKGEGSFDEKFRTDDDGKVRIRNIANITDSDWGKIAKGFKQIGYDVRSAEDAKSLYTRYENISFNEDQVKKLKQLFGAQEIIALPANAERARKAARKFGLTNDFREAGYLLRNGNMLDFSGKRDGGPRGHRAMDHREIHSVFDDQTGDGYSEYMIRFMNEGNIRIMEGSGVDLGPIEPTDKQYSVLRQFIDYSLNKHEWFNLDFSGETGYSIASREYEGNVSASKIISDIRHFFKAGELPYVSELQQFRYSLKKSETDRLKSQVERLKAQFKRSEGVTTKPAAVEAYARQILRDYDSDYNRTDLTDRLQRLYDFMANGEDAQGNELTFEQVREQAQAIALDVLENASVLEDTAYRDFAELRNYLRGQRISISDQYKNDLPNGFNAFRKANFGRFTLAKDGLPVETVFNELALNYPGIFDENAVTNPADQLAYIADFLDSIRPVYENPFAGEMGVASEELANGILEQFYETPQQGPTFADREAARRRDLVIRNAKKLETVREQRDAKIQEIKGKYTERLDRVIRKREADIDKLTEEYRIREDTRRERYIARDLRAKIKKAADRLSKRLLNPTVTNHVPGALTKPVAEFLNSINITPSFDKNGKPRGGLKSYEAFLAMKEAYQKLTEGPETDVNVVFDPDLQMLMSDMAAALKGKGITELSLTELQDLYKIIRAVEKSVIHYNKLFNKAIQRVVSDLGNEVMRENRADEGYRERAGALRRISAEFFNADLLSPVEFFDDTGETLSALYGYLREGLDKKINNISTAQEYMQALLGDLNISSWTGDKAEITTFELSNGVKLKMTPAQVMGLYLLQKQEKAQNHIYAGGIRPGETKVKGGKYLVKTYEPAKVNQFDVAKILDSLTDEQKRIADGISKFFKDYTAKWGNEVSRTLYGYDKFTEENYYPITSDPNYLVTDVEKLGDKTLVNMGITKSRLPVATNPIMVFDAFDVFTKQADAMSSYNAFVIPLFDFQKVWNYKSTDGSVKQALEKKIGNKANEYIKQFVIDVNGGIRSRESGSAIADFLTKKYKAATLGLNLRVILQQPTSFIRAAAIIDPKYLAKGLASRGSWAEVREHAALAKWRDLGYYSLDVGRQMKDVFVGKPSVTEKFMAPIGKADQLTWGKLWNAVKAEIDDTRGDLRKGSEEYFDAVSKRFNEIVDRTQVIDTIFHRTQYAREKGMFSRLTTSFMSEPMKQYNMLRSAVIDIKSGTEEGKARGARKIGSVAASMLVNAVVVSLIDALRDDDDKNYLEKVVEKMFGAKVFDGNFVEQFTGLVPYVRDVFSMLQGFDTEPLYTKGIQDIIDAAKQLSRYVGGGSGTPYTIIKKLASAIGYITGVPVKNVFREFETLVNTGINLADSDMARYAKLKVFYNVQSPENRSRFVRLLFSVEDPEDYENIMRDLIRNGMTKDYLTERLRALRKEQDEFKEQAADIREGVQSEWGNNPVYARMSDEYKAKASDYLTRYANADTLLEYEPRLGKEERDEIDKQIDALQERLSAASGDEAADLLTQIILLEQSKGYERDKWIRIADSGEEYGVSPADYILYKVALQMADDKIKDNDSLSKDEIAAALAHMEKYGYDERQLYFFEATT